MACFESAVQFGTAVSVRPTWIRIIRKPPKNTTGRTEHVSFRARICGGRRVVFSSNVDDVVDPVLDREAAVDPRTADGDGMGVKGTSSTAVQYTGVYSTST